ncbi:lipid II:glycine glycyltransferase FemX [Natrinema versiforme]|uniref:FemAB-like protein, PEP-CTERM system-associated n=1 Tax=Natrinema versiforme JCM 10478 TaxID=1227496 RepID=L9XZK8_9EURY|nr:GNAT family N-acetyltransferase [Natrinema versiforme]ELY67289.1 FemAB-like protein, PEP-CTERM system-associated [Natrinema versiforme JCM 10478]
MDEHSQLESQLTVTQCRDSADWDAYLERADGPVYGVSAWGDATAGYGHDRYHLVVRTADGILGALPLTHIQSRVFGSKLVSPPYAARGSIVTDDGRAATVRSLLLERTRTLADDLDVDFVSLRGRDLGAADGFEKRDRFVTFDIDLSGGPDATWENIKESRRRQIRQAADEAGVEYEIGTTVDDLREYYDLYLASMRGHGTPPHSFRFFRTLWDRLTGPGPGDLHLGLIRKDGAPINGIMDLSLGSTVYQWGVVTDYEYRDLNGGSLLLWKSLERAAAAGYDSYEMGRTREGSGVYMFKKSFGGAKTWYDDYHYFPSGTGSLPHPEDEKYEPIKRVWRKLPIPLTRLIGPFVRKDISL